MVDPVDLVDAFDRWDSGARAGRDQNPLCTELLVADPDRARAEELRLALMCVEPGALEVLDPLRVALLERVLARLHPCEVRRRRPYVDPELPGEAVHVVEQLRDDEIRLRRLASNVRTAASPARALDERDARIAQLDSPRRSVAGRGAGAEN